MDLGILFNKIIDAFTQLCNLSFNLYGVNITIGSMLIFAFITNIVIGIVAMFHREVM